MVSFLMFDGMYNSPVTMPSRDVQQNNCSAIVVKATSHNFTNREFNAKMHLMLLQNSFKALFHTIRELTFNSTDLDAKGIWLHLHTCGMPHV